jgi:hypothetical protein
MPKRTMGFVIAGQKIIFKLVFKQKNRVISSVGRAAAS